MRFFTLALLAATASAAVAPAAKRDGTYPARPPTTVTEIETSTVTVTSVVTSKIPVPPQTVTATVTVTSVVTSKVFVPPKTVTATLTETETITATVTPPPVTVTTTVTAEHAKPTKHQDY